MIEQGFDLFEFVLDSIELDATLKLSGAEQRRTIGMRKHIHLLGEVDGLPDKFEKEVRQGR